MAKINKKMSVDVKGILDLTDGFVKIEVEDVDEPIVLSQLIEEFDGKEVKITVNYPHSAVKPLALAMGI